MLARLGVDPMVEVVDNGGECLLSLLVKVGDGDTRGEDGIVWVLGGEVGGGLSGEVL
jgi:hypothetical protein